MRRLPIFFLIDISESMVGEQIQLVEEGLAGIIKSLKENPYALETVHLSIIVFAGQPQTLIPLQDVITFYPPKFPVGGGTSLSNGLGHLMHEMRKSIIKTTSEQKGDWKPIVFLFTDGVPTDDTTAAINEWRANWAKQANMVAISFGEETDLSLLRQLTDNVFLFKNSSVADYKKFFEWVTASIAMSSLSVDSGSTGFELAKVNDDV
ncbi:MAG: vWA domain-containing protein, partial [Flavobacteriales bacterium]